MVKHRSLGLGLFCLALGLGVLGASCTPARAKEPQLVGGLQPVDHPPVPPPAGEDGDAGVLNAMPPPVALPPVGPDAGTSPDAGTPPDAGPPTPETSFETVLAAAGRGELIEAILGADVLLRGLMSPLRRAYLLAQLERWVTQQSAAQVGGLLSRLPAGSTLRGRVLARQIRLQIAAGQEALARKALRRAPLSAELRMRLARAAGKPGRFGALLPLTGRLRALGQDMLRGLLLAADLSGRRRSRGATLVIRDSARLPAARLAELSAAGVLAVVGAPRSATARVTAPHCQRLGLPLITGADAVGIPALGGLIFRAGHAPPQRAVALARHAARTGKIQRVAILHANHGYGRRVAAAFAAEAKRLGLTVVATVGYGRKDNTIYPRLRPLATRGVQAVFIADTAIRLEVVAPQLALAGLQPAPLEAQGPGKVLLLSTAEGLSGRLMKNVPASVSGAVLAPGFFPDPSDPILGSFVQAFSRVFGRSPGRYAAQGYLALLQLRGLLLGSASGRVSVGRALPLAKNHRHQRLWNAQGERVDAPRLYRVGRKGIRRLPSAKVPTPAPVAPGGRP